MTRGLVPELEVTYEAYGELDGDNAVPVSHALTGSAHVAGRDRVDSAVRPAPGGTISLGRESHRHHGVLRRLCKRTGLVLRVDGTGQRGAGTASRGARTSRRSPSRLDRAQRALLDDLGVAASTPSSAAASAA